MSQKDTPKKTETEDAEKRFFHKTVNISKWMKERIADLVAEKGYSLLESDITCEVMTRMSKLSVLNTVSLKVMDSNKKIRELNNYSSIDKDYDGSHGLGWLVVGIKELEAEAALEFGSSLVGKKETPPLKEDAIKEAVSLSGVKAKTVKHVDVNVECHFSCNAEELLGILSDDKSIRLWTGSEPKDGEVAFENVRIRNIKRDGNTVKMEYKNQRWEAYTEVEINVVQVGSDSYLKLRQKGVPSDFEETVGNHWKQRVFGAISMIFRCVIKKVK